MRIEKLESVKSNNNTISKYFETKVLRCDFHFILKYDVKNERWNHKFDSCRAKKKYRNIRSVEGLKHSKSFSKLLSAKSFQKIAQRHYS